MTIPNESIPASPETRMTPLTEEHLGTLHYAIHAQFAFTEHERNDLHETLEFLRPVVSGSHILVSVEEIKRVLAAAEAIRDDDDESDEIEAAVSSIADANFIAQMAARWLSSSTSTPTTEK